jgi:hypothetical protein
MDRSVVIFDASNVAFRSLLPGQQMRPGVASWASLRAALDAWSAEVPDAIVLAIADASLLRVIDDSASLRQAVDAGEIRIAPGDADDLILEDAYELDAAVVTTDNYVGKRDAYPQIQDDHERFFAPRFQSGRIRFICRHMSRFGEDEIREAQRKDLKKAKSAESEDLRKTYRCTSDTAACPYGGHVLPPYEPPQFRDGRALCSRCGAPAEETAASPSGTPQPEDGDGRRLRLVHTNDVALEPEEVIDEPHHLDSPTVPVMPMVVAVTQAGVEIDRFEVAIDPIVIGRGSPQSNTRCITGALSKSAASSISREHLTLYCEDGVLRAIHNAANNFTFLSPPFDERGRPTDNRLYSGAEYSIEAGDELVLGNDVLRVRIVEDV